MMKLLLSTLLFSLILIGCGSKDRIVYINNYELFDKFQMKKDYDKQITVDLKSDSEQLDSINNMITFYTKLNVSPQKIDSVRQYFIVLKSNFDKKFEKISQNYTSQVNQRLNQYLKDLSAENGYDYILGNGNEGSLLFVNEKVDITKSAINYVNKRYKN